MAKQRKYERLIAWQKAIEFVDSVYDLTESWPPQELYGLTSQVRRAAVSVPANIAEGQGRTGTNEFLHHLSIAYGSLMEAETFLIVGRRRTFSPEPAHERIFEQSDEVGRLILGMMTSLRRSRARD